MNSNFFNSIAGLDFTGNLQITIAKDGWSGLVVSVLLQNDACGDSAKNLIPPLTLTGTADELDEGFFAKISAPIERVSGMMLDMEGFLAQVELAKQNSAMEKQKGEKARKDKEARSKRYSEIMAKVETLEKEGKFRDAWTKLPDPVEFSEHAEVIKKRKSELSARFAPDLFGSSAVEAKPLVARFDDADLSDDEDYPADELDSRDEEE